MFRKRQKKYYPPGTFIATPARICAIIQLCLAFSLLLWNASEPFVGEIFTLKSRILLYQDVIGIPANDQIAKEKRERLERNAARFQALPKQIKDQLVDNMHLIQKQLQRSFGDKIKSMLSLFAYKISPYELAWIFFSIIISILLLKRVEGAAQALWLLPVLTACYAIDGRLFSPPVQASLESTLFPTEQELVDHYTSTPLSEDVFKQQEQLLLGWKRYLIINWTKHSPSPDPILFEKQAEEGEFHFTLARLDLRAKQSNFLTLAKTPLPPSLPLILLYFFWNAYFAYTAWTHVYRSVVVLNSE